MWCGWLATGGTWERVCEAHDIGACASKLGRLGHERGIPARGQCLTTGAPPTFVPPTLPAKTASGQRHAAGSLAAARKCEAAAQALEKQHGNVSAS